MMKSFFEIDAAPAPTPTLTSVWLVAGAAIGVAILGTVIGFLAEPGINWLIWTVTAAACGVALAAPARHLARRPGVVTCLALAILVAGGAAVTADWLFLFFIAVAVVVLLTVALRLMRIPEDTLGLAAIAGAPLGELLRTGPEAAREAGDVMRASGGAQSLPVLRGLALAVPVVAVFALLLSGADPVLAGWRTALGDLVDSWDFLPRVIFCAVLGMLLLGAYAFAARAPTADAPAPARGPVGWRPGETERAIVMAGVAALFGVFLALQVTYLFGAAPPAASHMTYTEYAHRGFAELTIVATLCVILLVALYRHDGAPPRWSWLPLVVLVELQALVASAHHRIVVYEGAFGYTALRLYVRAYTLFIAVALVMLAWELWVGIDARRVARRVGIMAVVALAAFSYWNPEGWVVARNVSRYRATGKLDLNYLADLSPNAVPTIMDAMPALRSECQVSLLSRLEVMHRRLLPDQPTGEHWYEWNLRRALARHALRAAGPALSDDELRQQPASCNL